MHCKQNWHESEAFDNLKKFHFFVFTLKIVCDIIIFELLDSRGGRMNQILDYNPNKQTGGGSSSGSDKIVRVFAILLVLFALGLLISGGIGIYKNNKTSSKPKSEVTYATINAEQEDEGKVKLTISHDKTIEEVFYSWNTSAEHSFKGEGAKSLEKELELPANTNTLHIKVVDIEGIETSFEKEFTASEGTDILNPVISIDVVDGDGEDKLKKLKITATDETKLDFITYRWNNEEETKIEADDSNPKQIVQELDILRGVNDITIVAVDSSNNTTTETKSFTALTKPEVFVSLSNDGSSLDIKTTHENGIAKIYYTLNGREYQADFKNDLENPNPKDVQFSQPLDQGYNRFILTVTSVDDTETLFDGECEYNPAGGEASDNNAQTEE